MRKNFVVSVIVGLLCLFTSGISADVGPQVGKEYRPPGTHGGPMMYVPEGNFWMGCNEAVDKLCKENEKPYHQVYLDAFYMDKYEVTLDDYMECVKAGGCKPPEVRESQGHILSANMKYCNWKHPGRGKHPINCVEWFKAKAYCEYAGKRLPTEAEWEKAARGTDGRIYPWGNQPPDCNLAIVVRRGKDGCGKDSTWPVGSKPKGASPYGIMDMAGNVAEMAADWKDTNYYKHSPRRNPKGPDAATDKWQKRIIRGGNFNDDTGWFERTSFRAGRPQWDIYHLDGFRCAKDVE